MRILIDINHPAHVHYFRNFIKIMEKKGHEFRVINRDSFLINYLLDYYGIKHVIRNQRPKRKGTIASLMNLGRMTYRCIYEALDFKPDMFLGFASSACAIASKLLKRPSILIDDTEHNTMNHKIYLKFCSVVMTPFYFKKNLGKKQLYFNAFVEQLYLHTSIYNPTSDVLNRLGVKKGEYILVRYISYDAHHDLVANPITEKTKKRIVDTLKQKHKVFVSHESPVNPYAEYGLEIAPEEMHDIEANAKFVITEGATMGCESFVLGVPSLYINPLKVSYTDLQARIFPETYLDSINEESIINAIELLESANQSNCSQTTRCRIEENTINPTEFLVWFVENYPNSERIIRGNPEYMNKFKSIEHS